MVLHESRKRARWIVVAVCTLLIVPLSAAHARSGTTNLTLHLEAGVIVEPPRLLNGVAEAGPARPLADAGCDGLEAQGGLVTGPWRVLSLHVGAPAAARIVTGAGSGTAVTPRQTHCGTIESWGGGRLQAARSVLHGLAATRAAGAEGRAGIRSVTLVVEQL